MKRYIYKKNIYNKYDFITNEIKYIHQILTKLIYYR